MSRNKKFEMTMTLISAATPAALFGYHLVKNHQPQSADLDGAPKAKSEKFFRGAFNTPFASALSLDLTFTLFVFWRLVKREIAADRARGPFWLYFLISMCVGVSPAFPLLLLLSKDET